MIKFLNRYFKFFGFKILRRLRKHTVVYSIVRAKRPKAPKSEAQRVGEFLDEFLGTPRPPYTREELENALPSNPGKTHYVGDDCPGGHRGEFTENGLKNTFIGLEAKVHVVDPDAAFVPVDIGVNDHETTRVEHPNWETAGGTTPEQNEARFNEPK